MADLKTTNIYGDAYINNKVGINTNTPATRLQIGQLSPTAATEGIQFGDDTGARLYRDASGRIAASGNFTSVGYVIANTYLQTLGNLIYPSSQTATQRLEVGNASGNAWVTGISIAQGGNVTVYNNLTVNNNATVTNDLTVNGNTYLGNANGDTVFVNDTIRIGATDSGDASLFFGEGGVAGSDYGARWYWDSGYTFTWYTRNAGTDTALFDYVTNDLNYINWRRHFHMQNKEINYNAQVHFNAGTRFVGNNTSYLIFRSDSTGAGGIQVQDGSATNKGYTGYWDAAGGGILNNTGNWAVRYNFGNANSGGTLYGAWTVNGNISATNLSGTNTGDQTVGNGTITIAAGTGIGVGTSNTFTTNQTGNSTVTITNSGVTSLTGTANRVTVSAATGAVTLNLPQDIHTGASPSFSGLTVTGITMTNLTGAYQNTTVYDSPKTQSATPSRGIRAPASSIQFTDSYAIAPFWTYRSTGDWPVPYGIGWGTGGESSGIFQRYASNGSSFGDMIFYTGNDGSGAFSFRRHTWEGTTHFAAGSGELNTELFRIDWSGNLTMLGTLNGSANSATLYANNGSYGAWAINGTRNGWGGIEFANNGVSLMMGSDTVGFHQNTNGWLFRVHNGSGFIYKGAWGGGTAATIYDTTNGNGVLLRAAGVPAAYGDWNTFGNATQTTNGIVQEFFNLGSGTGNSNFPPVSAYYYGILLNFGSAADARAQVYISHAGNDLIFRGGWGTASWQTWNRVLTNINQPYAYAMNQYTRTTDTPTFAGVYTNLIGINDSGMDCYMEVTDANPTFNYETYGGEFLFYGDKSRPSSLLYVGGIDVSRTIIANAISSRDYTRQLFPGGGYYHEGGSVTGAIKIRLPVNTETKYPMLSFTCHIYNYSTGTSVTFKIGGHYSDTQWYNVFAYSMTDSGVNYNVRWGYEGTYLAVWIGETNTGWSYPNVFITDFQNGYSAIDGIWMTGWSVTRVTAFDTVTNGPYAPGHFWNQKNDGAGSGLDADLLDGYNSATAGTANTIVLRDSSGHITGQYILGSYFNASAGNSENPTIGQIWTQNTSDNYLRKSTPAHFRSQVTDGSYPSLTGANASGTWSISITGNAATATTLQTARAINGVSFNGSAAITVNGLNYNVNNDWLRENGDDDQFKLYGNSRTMIYRTDGNTNAHGGGAFAHIFYYGGSADANRMFIINTDGRLWSPYHGWLDTMSISGNAATVTNGIYTTNYWTGTPLGKRRYRIHSSDGTSLNSSITNLECGFTYGGSGEPTGPFIAFGGLGGSIDYSCQLVGAYSGGGNDFKIRTRNDDTAAWNTWRTIVTDGNYTSYSPTLTGTGASGNWAINVTGNAATATTLQTARNINGTSFNGSAAITTATWGTARTITIGSTGKSVDGSANVSWTLAEIGAAATNQTMFIGTTSVAINRASAAITLTGTSIDGNAATATSATSATNSTNASYQSATGTSNDWTQSFQQTPAHATSFREMSAGGPAGTWWMLHNFRHSNNTNYWGTQVAWGWEDNANTMYTRNVLNGAYGSWVKYINSANYTDYTVTKTGTGASGNWAINITGNAATATTATNVTIANGSVTLAKIENITAYTILGNSNASAAATPAALSVATVATMLSGQTMNINGSSTSCSGTAANATTAGGLAVHTGTNNEANKIVRTQGNGYIMAGWINTISGDNGTTAIDRVYASSDGYIRYYTPANFRTVLDVPTRAGSGASGNWAINITGNAATATSATSATTATNVAASGITGQTGMWTSAARPGPYRLYRNDHDSAYNLQLTWQAHRTNYWSLRGYLNDTFHAECFVVYSGYADEAGALTIGNTYRVANLGINVAASNKLHINGDNTNPAIRIDNGALVTGVASNSKNTFQGYLPVSFGGTTYYIRLWT